jgi:hypothetical protein
MSAHSEHELPSVSNVSGDTIIELVYNAQDRKTALIVSRDGEWTVEQRATLPSGETLVPYPPSNNLIRHGCVLLPSEPADYGNKEALLSDIQSYLHRYVDLSPVFERLAAYYVLLSWVFDAFNEIPYLRFKGDYGSGKTRALIALGSITYRGFFASGASTVSPIFHTLDNFGGTLVLDEGDLRFSDKTAELVKILNNGTVKGLPVLRTLQNRHKEFNPAAFNVFGPKIIAMRGTFRDQALESRFLTEEMGTRPLRADIPIQLPDSLKTDALQLRNKLLAFRLKNLHAIKSDPARVVSGIDPRLNQVGLSLLSLIDDAQFREEIAAMLRTRHAKLVANRTQNDERRVLAAAEALFAESNRSMIPLHELSSRIGQDGEPVSPRMAGQVLRAHSYALWKSHGTIVVGRRFSRAS